MSTKNESMTQTFDRFNKLIGELATVGVQIDQDDLNRKFLRSLSDAWTMYTVSFRQNDQLEEKELDDLYNDLRVFEYEVEAKKRPSGYVHNAALLSASIDSTSNPESVSAANGANQEKGTETVFEAFLASHGNSSLINDDLEQLHPDNLEEMDIKWQMAMLSMRVKKFIKRTGRNNFSQRREDGAGFDKSKGMGFDWSDQAEEAIQNQALMAEVSDLPTEKRIGYKTTPPPYNNNYIPPSSDLLETKDRKDLPKGATEIDPLDEVVVKDKTEKEVVKDKDNTVSGEIPIENHIITNEGCGKHWVKSNEIEKTEGKNKKVYYKQTTVVNPIPCKQCACNKSEPQKHDKPRGNQRNWNNQWAQKQGIDLSKINRPKPCFICGKLNHLAKHCFFNPINQQMNFQRFVQKPVGYRKAGKKHVGKKSVETKGPMKKKVLKESIKIWVPRSTKIVSTADRDSAARSITAATSVSTAENFNTANTVTTSNKVSTAKHASAANAVSTSKTSIASSKCVSKPIIGNQQLKGKSIWHVDSGCSRHMTCNMSCLQDFKHINGGHVAFGDNLTGGKISGKGFKVVDESMILLRTPRKDNVYCLDMDNVSSDSSLNCLVSKASVDESSLWHRRMCHMNFKTMNKLVKNNLVRGLPSKVFSCDDHCVACLKGKQHKTSHKTKELNTISSCLQLLHMDLFGPTNVMSMGKKSYCLVIVDDYSRFTWVYFLRTKDETKNDNVKCNENTPNPIGSGPQWLFDIDSLTNSFGFSSDDYAGSGCGGSGTTQVQDSISQSVIFPIPTVDSVEDCEKEPSTGPNQSEEESRDEENQENQEPEVAAENTSVELNDSNLEVGLNEEPSHHTRIQKNHPPQLVIGDISSPMMTRNQSRLQEMQDQQHTMLSCFLSQLEPKKAHDAMKESSWIEAMQEELLQFKLQDVWDLVDLPKGQRAIGTKWVFRNKRDERGIVIRNKARLVAQGYTEEEGIDYEEVFAPVARIEAIRLFLAYASYMKFKVYQMDVKSAFLYGSIEEEVYVCQPPGFENPSYPDRVYKLKKSLYGLHQAPRAWYDTLSSYLLENGFERGVIDKTLFIKRKKKDILLVQIYVDDIIFGSTRVIMCKKFEELMHQRFKMSSIGELTFFLGLQVQQKSDGIFICQSKYVQDILTKFGFSDSKPASTPTETHKQITADLEAEDMDLHHYRSMIGSLMYLTAYRPDIMFPVCVCARFQVRPKQSHYLAVKRIFRYLKGQPRLGLWYPHNSPFDLLAYSDSDLGGANLDRKSTSGGCQFLGARLVSWQCKKQTTVSTSTTEAEYIVAASCCSQVLWIQNQMLDYGVTFLHTPIFIDNSSAISIVNNPVKHSKTKHIEIKYHFIRDCNEKKLIQVVKVHTDNQFADLFTKAFDVGRFTFLVTSVGMINSE
ncbi:hypothetical protein L6452_19451 [Arctium lappa]|uniref:Uncharacterized protein n=1 Tax=Arctium lappa TaxID=4217 RepID=A0ACB9B7W3_ARCLA|nr:hypothetical protein L6452_19451 [Arctium lappa]